MRAAPASQVTVLRGSTSIWLLVVSLLLVACGVSPEPRLSSSRPLPPIAPEAPSDLDDGFERAADCKDPLVAPTLPADPEKCPLDCPGEARDLQGCCPDVHDGAAFARACRACDPWACLSL